jgi:hypothetical protein
MIGGVLTIPCCQVLVLVSVKHLLLLVSNSFVCDNKNILRRVCIWWNLVNEHINGSFRMAY